MTQSIVEYLREQAVNDCLAIKTVDKCWPTWQQKIHSLTPSKSAQEFLDLGDHLAAVFATTGEGGRTQDALSGGGSAWESLVCWYLNLCLVGTRTVVMKPKKNLLPDAIFAAMSVSYGGKQTNTEADLIAITFPDHLSFMTDDPREVKIMSKKGDGIENLSKNGQLNYKAIMNTLLEDKCGETEILIIQCKTNWNDNAQIPMLWGMLYEIFRINPLNKIGNITIGKPELNPSSFLSFKYAFITVPTQKVAIKPDSMAVNRVNSLSGGNYWGRLTQLKVAKSVKEIFLSVFSSSVASEKLLLDNLEDFILHRSSRYAFFKC